ncbi:chlamydia polymorphic membrane middle domain protein, partial [Chlamydia psittaci 08DC60]
KVKQSQSMLSI